MPRAGHTGAHSVLVFFCGGSWSSGTRGGDAFVGRALAAQGFVAVVPNYPKLGHVGLVFALARPFRGRVPALPDIYRKKDRPVTLVGVTLFKPIGGKTRSAQMTVPVTGRQCLLTFSEAERSGAVFPKRSHHGRASR